MEHQWTKISSRIWLDERVLALDPEGFKLFVYVMTNQDRMDTGLSRFSVGLASDITGVDYGKCKGLVEGFCKPLPEGFGWMHDKRSNTLLIPTWLDDKKLDSKNTLDGILKTLALIPTTPLIVDWFHGLCKRLKDKEQLKHSNGQILNCTKKDLLAEVKKYLSKSNFKALTDGLGEGLAETLTKDLGVRTKNQEPSIKNQNSLEDHKCLGGDARGGHDAVEAVGASAPMAESSDPDQQPEAYRDDWSNEFCETVRDLARRRFGSESELRFDRRALSRNDYKTLYKVAACEACGEVPENWVVNACNGVLTVEKKPNNPALYLFGILKKTAVEKCGRKYQQILAPVKLPEELLRPPPRGS